MTALPQVSLAADYRIPRLIKGGWQLAGGHGEVDTDAALADMLAFADAGMTAFDCADIYTGVEELIGHFIRFRRNERGTDVPPIRVHTKCVPDLDALRRLKKRDIARIVERSLKRIGVERLDLVQFHWWDYDVPAYVDAAMHLHDLQLEGKIHHLGATNFGTGQLTAMLNEGVPLVSHQVQISLLDRRALHEMATLTQARGVGLLAYGALAGGFLHERWLTLPEPEAPLENRSLVKYKLIIDDFGGWPLFQRLLAALKSVAREHETTIGAIAIAHVLDQKAVSAAIIGARSTAHLVPTLVAATLVLSDEQRAVIDAVLEEATGPLGDVYALEREKGGRHAAIMRYNLNTA